MITCEICGEKPAKIHVTQIKDGKKITAHMCPDCARKQALSAGPISQLSVSGMLQGLLNQQAAAPVPKGPTGQDLLTCASCGQTLRGFKESGQLGCSACYETFSAHLAPLLGKIQKGERHVGKRPRGHSEMNREDSLADLRRRLQEAVEQELFEQAVKLRDEIRRLENQEQT